MLLWTLMHLAAIKIFCDVVRRRSFSRAAGLNGLTQSAVSQNVSQLERSLGVRLIDRSRRPFQLTPEGRRYYQGCRGLVERYYAIEAEVKHLRTEVGGTVRVAAIYSVGLDRMSRYVRRYCELHPQSQVRMSYVHPDEVYRSVLEGEADVGLVSYPRVRRGLASLDWRREPMVLACAPGHPLAGRGKITGRELNGVKFVGFVEGLRIGREVEGQLRRHGCEPDVVLRFDNVETIKRAVELGDAVSVLPEPMLNAEVRQGTLAAVALVSPRLSRPMGILFRKGAPTPRAVQEFIELIRHEGASDPVPEGQADGARSCPEGVGKWFSAAARASESDPAEIEQERPAGHADARGSSLPAVASAG